MCFLLVFFVFLKTLRIILAVRKEIVICSSVWQAENHPGKYDNGLFVSVYNSCDSRGLSIFEKAAYS